MFDLESRPVRLNPWISLLKKQLARVSGPRRRGQRAQQRQWARAVERLEDRCLLAAPELVAVLPNVGSFLVDNQVRTQAPDELTLRFSPGQTIDVNSLGGIVLTRAGFDGDFEEANVYSDFNTNGAVVVEFDAQRLGVGGNGITMAVSKADLGLGVPPTISVVGTAITATLNSNVVTPTTAQSFVDAINNNPGANALVQATIRSGVATTNIAAPTVNYSPLVLRGANAAVATTNFNTAVPLEVKFESKVTGPSGNGVSIVFRKADLGAAGNPTVVVTTPAPQTNPVTPAVITVTLNANAGNITTAQRLVTAITSSVAANALVRVTVPVGDATTDITTPVTINPLTLDGANDESSNSAFVQSSFNLNPFVFQMRFEAVPMGAAGNGISLTFNEADLGVAGLPSISVLGTAITVTLNTNKLSTASDLITAITANAAANRLVRALVVTGVSSTDIVTPAPVGLQLVLGGGTDVLTNAGYFARTDPVNNEVVYRFAQPLPDDLYRIEVYGQGPGTILRNTNVISPATTGEAFNNGLDSRLSFDLDLGAQVTAVVPQPVLRNKVVTVSNIANLREGDRILLTAGGNQVVLEFNDTQTATGTLPGNVPVLFDSTQLAVAGYANTVAAAIATAIGGSTLDATASQAGAIVTIAGRAFNPTASTLTNVAGVLSIADGGLTQRLDIVTVNFNEDPLNPVEANNPAFYQLIDTSNNAILIPTSVTYDSTRHTARLQFAASLPTSTFRLRIGESTEANNTTANAINVGTLFTTTGYSTTAVIGDNTGVALPDDVDLYKFVLNTAATGVTITATPLPAGGTGSLDAAVRLFDSAGVEIGVPTNAVLAGIAEVRNTGALAAGTYYIGVSSTGNVVYSAVTGAIGAGVGTTTGSYQLAVNVAGSSIAASDDNSSFGTATSLGTLGSATQTYASQIEAQTALLLPPLPGGSDDPGHRDIPAEDHGAGSGTTPTLPGTIETMDYFFGNAYGVDAQGNTLFNQINAAEKQRTREIFEIFASRLGMQFRETSGGGLQVVTGDPRVAAPTLANPPPGIQGGPGVVMSAALRAGNGDDYGGAWMSVAFHEIGHAIGLGHSYDIPSIQGGGLVGEQVLTGDFDWIHALRNHAPFSTDIDLYQFTVAAGQSGTFSAETIAERLATTSLLNTALTLYSEVGGVRTLISRNDDYYSNDSYLTAHLDPGTYYIGVTSTGNTNYDPTISDSGYGGMTDGLYTLQLNFTTDSAASLHDVDATATNLDGDADRLPGGVYEFDFQGDSDSSHTIVVDKSAAAGGTGTIASPYNNLQTAVGVAASRIVVPAALGIVAGQTFTISDGTNPAVTFTFVAGVPVAGSSQVALGASASAVATNIAFSITNLAAPLNTTATATGDRVDLLNATTLNVAGTPALLSGVNILRLVGNGGTDNNSTTINNNLPYQVGRNDAGGALPDGATFEVPQGVTVMIDAGAIIKLQGANLDAGTSSATIDRSQGAVQVLGTPTNRVYFTSWHNDTIGGDSDAVGNPLSAGNWGGLVFRSDSDQPLPASGAGVFLNYVNHADLSYGGGTVIVNSVQDVFDPVHLISTSTRPTRPTISHNRITFSADAAISADPNSFNDVNGRIGPDIHNNQLFNNSTNGLFVRIRTSFGSPLDKLDVTARFNDTDIVHVITENLVLNGSPGGPLDTTARLSGRLAIDPGVVVKLRGSRIEMDRGASRLIAEGTAEKPIRFTSLLDDRYGSGGTFDTGADGNSNPDGTNGDWGGLTFEQVSSGSLDHIYLAYAGGTTPIEGSFDRFNPIEIRQADVRLTNSLIENNASGQATTNRKGRGTNNASTIFVLGSQPLIVNNIVQNNLGNFISINANSLVDVQNADYGRSTGSIDTFTQFADNHGPLVRLNRLDLNGVNGMHVRGEQLTVAGVWDDTDIVHVLQNEVSVNNVHTYGGLRLQSDSDASLVVKLQGASAGLTANGSPADINDRIGGTVQVVGQPGFPVVMTSLTDCSIGAGFQPDGNPQTDTLNSGKCDPGQVTPVGNSGAVLIDGGDRDDHGSATAGPDNTLGTADDVNQTGWLFIEQSVNFAYNGARNNAPNDVLVIGATAGGGGPFGGSALPAITSVTTVLGLTQTVVTGAAISAINFNNFRVIYVPSDSSNAGGGITDADLTLLTARKVEIQNFVNAGGSLVALTEAGAANPLQWLELPLPFQLNTTVFGIGGLRKTPEAIAAGFTITDIELSNGTPYHNTFTGPPGFNGLIPFVLDEGVNAIPGDADDEVVTLGLASGSFGIGVVNPASAGDWRSIQLNQYSNDRNVAVYNEREKSLTGNVDLNANPTTAEFLGQLAPDDKSGDDLLRLGYEVHGDIATDAPTDVDVYSFSALTGTEVWLDIDRTSSALDTMVELIDSNGTVVARSLNNSTLSGSAFTLIKVPNLGGDYFSQNPRDAGFRVTLPGTAGLTGTYFVRVRSQPVAGSENTLAGLTSGRYQLQIRLRQIDEFPGSTVSFADIRYATNGVEVSGLPYHSPLLGDTEETTGDNNSTGGAQQLGNLLNTDRNTFSTAGDISSATDVDFYRFTVDYQNIQVVPGLNAPTTTTAPSKTWATVLDVDYANGLTRTDSTLALYKQNTVTGAIELVAIGRDSNIADDQPAAGQGNDLDDLSRGTVGKLDPFLGSLMLPTGIPGQDSAAYLVSFSSDQLIPTTLSAQFVSNASLTNQLTRLEPANGTYRIVEDHIGFLNYHSNGAQVTNDPTATQITTPLVDISSIATLDTHIVPFSLNDVLLFVNQANDIFTVNPSRGGVIADLTGVSGMGLTTNTLQDIVMRSDGQLFAYQRLQSANFLNPNNSTAGALQRIDTGNAALALVGNDNIPGGIATVTVDQGGNNQPVFNDLTFTDNVDALTFERQTGFGNQTAGQPNYSLYYSVRDNAGVAINSKLYRANPATGSAAHDTNLFYGIEGDIQPNVVTFASANTTGSDASGGTTIRLEARAPGAAGNGIQVNFTFADQTQQVTVAGNTITVAIDSSPAGTIQQVVDLINSHAQASQLVIAAISNGSDRTLTGAPGNRTLLGGLGTPLRGNVTGLAFANFSVAGNQLYGITNRGEFLQIDKNSGDATVVRDIETLDGVTGFQGLAIGPQNVNGGAFATTLFAVTDTGALYAIDPTNGTLQAVFDSNNDGAADALTVASGVPTATGLAFSPLDFNLWHPTDRRGAEAGHGINAAFDNSRTPGNEPTPLVGGADTKDRTEADGGASLYFGLDLDPSVSGNSPNGANDTYFQYVGGQGQYGVLNEQVQQDLTSNAGIANTYNLPGGALGSVVTNSFSLTGYNRTDKPTLYFNYLLQTEDQNADNSQSAGRMRDSARVSISRDSGATWQLVATNNSILSSTATSDAELPSFLSVSRTASTQGNQQAQELFETRTWRQARVDLADYAGNASLMLRFDFSTAGTMGTFGTATHNSAMIGLPGDENGLFQDGGGEFARTRGQNNQFEGFFVDDIIVGFAERGEMVTSATSNLSSSFNLGQGSPRTTNPDPDAPKPQLTGAYQLEIRRGTEYATVADPTDILTSIGFNYDTNDRLLTTATFKNAVGTTDDFETGDFSGAPWQPLPTPGPTDKPFILTSVPAFAIDPVMGLPVAGAFSARSFYDPTTSTPLGDNERSRLQITVYTGDGDMTFTRRVSSEAAGAGKAGDVYRFFIDVSGGDYSAPLESLSGVVGATTVSFHVDAGVHTFLWEYVKDGSVTSGQDGFFLDDITFPAANKALGDENFHREQGQILIANNLIRNVSLAGIVVAAAPRDGVTNSPHPGSPINFDTLNTPRLAPGVTIANNVVTDFTTNGISFGGEPNTAGNVPAAAVPFGRIVNNTIYGGATAVGTGINVSNNASPTILNNIIANTANAMIIDNSSSTGAISATQTGTFVFQGNTSLGTVGGAAYAPTPNDIQLLATDALFLSTTSFYLASGSKAIDSSINVLPDRAEYVAVTGALGIPESPIFAPDRDLYGQLRRDDPAQASFPGLGSNIFKDRGAVERADFLGPTARMVSPLDNDPSGVDLDATGTNIHIDLPAGSAPLTQFIVEILDAGIGVDDVLAGTSLKYTLQRDGVTLFDGVDYQFVYNNNTNQAIFTSVSTFPLDSRYTLTIANDATNGIKDLAGNRLQGNQPSGIVVFTILVTNGVNDAPVNSFPGPQAVIEDGALNFSALGNNAISISDVDAHLNGSQIQVTLTVTNGTAATTDDGILTMTTTTGLTFGPGANGTNTMTFAGTIAAINTALNTLRFNPGLDRNDLNNLSSTVLTVTTSDLGNTHLPLAPVVKTDTDQISITVIPVNDEPVITTIPNQGVAPLILEDSVVVPFTLNLTGLFAARATATDEIPPAATVQSLVPSVSSSIVGFFSTLTITNFNAALGTADLNFLPALNGSGLVTVTVTLVDNGGIANLGDDTLLSTFTIFVTPVNDEPLAVADAYTVNEDTTLTADGVGVNPLGVLANDSDPNDTNPANVLNAVLVGGAPTNALSFTLNSDGTFTYTPVQDFNGTDTFQYEVRDDGGVSNGGDNIGNIVTVTITVNGVNDAPVNTLPATYVTNEDIGLPLSGINIVDVDVAAGNETVTFSVTSGTLAVNTAVGGGVTAGQVTNNGTATVTITAPLAAINATLANATGLTFNPASNKFGTVTLTMNTNDNGNTGVVFVTRSDSDTSIITVNSVNDAPVGASDFYATAEDTPIAVAASVGVLANDTDPNDTPPVGTGPKNALSVNGATPGTPLVLATANGGTVTLNSNGSFIYTPPTNFVGSDTFTYRVRDDGLTANGGNDGTNPLTSLITVFIDVGGINDPPVNNLPASQTTIEDTPLVFSSLNGNQISVTDPDAGGNPVRVTLSVNNGTLTLSTIAGLTFTNGDGTSDASMTFTGAQIDINTALNGMSFVPTLDFHGAATLSIISNDLGNTGLGGPQGDSDTLAITILASNDAPIALADSYSTNEDATLTVNTTQGVLFNDGDPHDVPANQLFANLVTGPTNGTLNLATDGSFSYTPSLNYNGVDSFTYRVTDSGGTANNGVDQGNVVTVTITINPVNDAPVNNLPVAAQSVLEDNPLVLSIVNTNAISVTDVDVAGSALLVTLTATDGVLTLSGLAGLTFSSGDGAADPSMAFTGTLAAINTALNGLTFLPAANFNTPGTGRTATVNITTNDQGFTGAGSPLEDSDTVFITVNPVNDPPVAQPDFYSTSEDTTLTVAASGVLGNDSDPLDNPANVLSATKTTDPSNGTLTVFNANGGFTYVPNPNFNGTDSFTYQVRDNGLSANGGNDTGNTVTVTINVGPVNDAPVNAVPGTQSMLEERTLVFSAANSNLISTSDIDAGATSVRVTLTSANGTASLGSLAGLTFSAGDGTSDASMTFSGTLAAINAALAGTSFTPSVNFTGTASLSVTTNDLGNSGTGGAQSDTDLILINVANINDPPVALPDVYSVNEDSTLTVLVTAGVLVNDNDSADAPADTLTATNLSDPLNGTLTFNTNGSFTYVPNTNFNGTDSFTYAVSDNGGILNGGNFVGNTVTVTITVNAVNDAPVNNVPAAQTNLEDTARLFNVANGNLISVTDVDAASSSVRVTLTGANGTATLGLTTGLIFTTGDGTSDASMTFTGTLAAINAALVGTSFLPAANFVGTASLTIATNDLGNSGSGGVLSDTDSINITVTSVNDPPVAVANSYTTNEDTPLTIAAAQGVLTNDTDPNDTPANVLNAVKVTDPLNGTLSLNADGSFTYTPALNYNGPDSFQYQVQDNGGILNGGINTGNTVTVNLTVNPVNDAPVNNLPAAQTTDEDTAKVFASGLGNAISITDVDSGSSSVRVTLTATNGTLTLSTIAGLVFSGGDGTTDATMTFTGNVAAINTALTGMSFAPTSNFNGTATLTMVSNDQGNSGSGGTLTDTDALNITVNAVNDAPVNSVPGAQTTNDEDPVTFSAANGKAITLSDVDAGSSTVRLTLFPIGGLIQLPTQNGLTLVQGDGSAGIGYVFDGTLANLNTALNGLQFRPTTDFNGAASLQVMTGDQGNTGTGGPLSDSDTINITVNDVNDAPVNSLPGVQTVAEDGSLVFNTTNNNRVSINDVDARSGVLRVVLTTANGTLSLGSTSGLTFLSGNGTQNTSMSFTGTLANLNTALNNLTFFPNANFNGSASFTMTTDDQGNSGSGGSLSDTDTVALTTTSVNDAPTVGNATPALRIAVAGDPFTIAYATLLAAMGAADVDIGDVTQLRVEQVINGTLTKGGVAVVPGTTPAATSIGPNDSLVWTPPNNVNASLPAFVLRAIDSTGTGSVVAATVTIDVTTIIRYLRSYNPRTDYHFFTMTVGEFNNAVTALGYRDENTGRPGFDVATGEIPVQVPSQRFMHEIHRLYNPNNNRHYYTANTAERDFLVTLGYRYEKDEGYIFTQQVLGTVPIFRLYNTNSGTHLLTESATQRDTILAQFPGIWVRHSDFGFAFPVSASGIPPILAVARGAPALAESSSLSQFSSTTSAVTSGLVAFGGQNQSVSRSGVDRGTIQIGSPLVGPLVSPSPSAADGRPLTSVQPRQTAAARESSATEIDNFWQEVGQQLERGLGLANDLSAVLVGQ
ncbi:MAG: tandem-95 repeat protein [Planctomycetales bacterium]|nr:tandem-95 repeat protein [Planctomycetales bacterium]